MNKTASLATQAGVVIVAGLVLLIGFSFRAGGGGWFDTGYRIYAEFESAKGIESGSPVVLAGVPIGQVRTMEVVPEKRAVRMTLGINEPHRIARDAKGSIQLKTLLGTYEINVTYGTPEQGHLEDGDTIETETVKGITEILADLGKMGESAEGMLGGLQEDAGALLTKLEEVVDENRENIKQTTDALANAAPEIEELVGNLKEVSRKMAEGEGTIGRLLSDEQLYEEVQTIVRDVADFTATLDNEDSILAMLTRDPEQREKLEQITENVRSLSSRLEDVVARNEQNIDRALEGLADIDQITPRVGEGVDHFVSIARKIDEGEGTLGKLVNDPEVYNNLRDAVAQIRRTFEEGEEQGVMRTFLSVVFGALL